MSTLECFDNEIDSPYCSTKRALDQNLEERLNIKDLEALQDAFMHDGDGYDNKLSLTKEQFNEALMLILNKGSREEYNELFDRIDITKEGTVDWDKFASHMLLDFYELDDKIKSTQVPQWKNLKILQAPHKEIIQRVSYLKNTNRYVSISKEGTVAMWAPSMRLMRIIKTGIESCRSRDLWVTDFVCLQSINKIALAFTSKEIAIYDLSSKMEFTCQYKLCALPYTPLCLDFWSDHENPNLALITWGDTSGSVNIIHFTSANISLFDRPAGAGGDNQEASLNITLKDIVKGKFRSSMYSRHHGHTGWVRQVEFTPALECFISCATTWQDSVVIAWLEKRSIGEAKLPMKTTTIQISQGINAFAYSVKSNLIATAGVNHHVLLWNPYVVSKPNGVLRGHMTSVVQVKFIDSRGQLISFSKDKVLRIWDVQLQVCIQRLAETFPKGPEVTCVLMFHEEKNRLFITFNYMLTLLEMKEERRERVMSHEKPVVSARFNPAYNQVITVGQDGMIFIWMVDTGQKVKQLDIGHNNAELTTLTLDASQNRMYSGATDGTVKVWDTNGHCYHTLTCGGGAPADIAQVIPLKLSMIVVGWSRHITVFRNNMMRDFHVEPSDWKGGQEHQDDILAAAFDPPTLLVTGSYDGEIIIWNTNSEQPSRRLSQRTRRRFMKSRGKFQSREPTSLYQVSVKDEKDKGYDSHKSNENNMRPKSRSTSRISTGDNDENNEFGFAISRLSFLDARRNKSSDGGANLISCGGNGWVRFWSTQTSELLAEFVAHKHTGSIIMAVDKKSQYLITGDVDGLVKVWIIQHYCLYKPENENVLTFSPPLQAQYRSHTDIITSIDTCVREERLLIITASLDGSVALTDASGTQIGIFGQEQHWKIEPYVPLPAEEIETKQLVQKEEQVTTTVADDEDSTWEPDLTAMEKPVEYRVSTWDNTLLGKTYQELRVQKRERRQPSTIPDLPYLYADKTGAPPAGPHAALKTVRLDDPLPLLKPDFIENPERYFKNPDDEILSKVSRSGARLPQLAETLRAAFDERSLFPKYILDFEAKMRQDHASNLLPTQSKISKPARRPSVPQVNFLTPLTSRPSSPKGQRNKLKIDQSKMANMVNESGNRIGRSGEPFSKKSRIINQTPDRLITNDTVAK